MAILPNDSQIISGNNDINGNPELERQHINASGV